VSAIYPKNHYSSFSSRSGTPFIASRLFGPNSVTGRASDDQGLGSLDDTIFVAKLSRVRNLIRLRSDLLGGKIQNTVLTLDKVLNILIYGSRRFD